MEDLERVISSEGVLRVAGGGRVCLMSLFGLAPMVASVTTVAIPR